MTGGKPLYYIDIEEAFKLKLDSVCNFTQKHPQDENYALITIPINREEN